MTVEDFFRTRKYTTCPSFESVTRARRKVCERRPDLKPEEVTQARNDMVDVYVDYARNG